MQPSFPLRIEPPLDSVRIDCDECTRQGTATCEDCVVTHLCDRPDDSGVVVEVADVVALLRLGNAGLAPRLRHQRRTG